MTIEKSTKQLTRQDFLKGVGKTIAGVTMLGGVSGILTACSAPAEAGPEASVPVGEVGKPVWPFPYVKLDGEQVAERAYKGYYTGMGCGYGAYEGIIGELASREGYPYNQIPTESMALAAGGYAGLGTLCGALGGAAVAVGVLTDADTGKKIIAELWKWYKDYPFPQYQPKDNDMELPTTLAGSVQCADSVGNFMEVQGCAYSDPERKERCGRLTADVVLKTIELLNEMA